MPGTTDDPPFPMDALIANVMLYWINGCIAPMWLCMAVGDPAESSVVPNTVPAAFLQFPGYLMPPAPRSWVERSFAVARYTVGQGGGHFPALDNSELLFDELRALASELC